MPEMLKDRYVLSTVVRSGAQATVTRAFDHDTGKLVAVKRVPFGPDDGRARDAFQREVSILQKLSHPNIVELIQVDQDEAGRWFLVLDWIDDTLEDVIKREGPTPWTLFWSRMGEPLLDAICSGQQKGVAHRDIKPKNILVTADGVPKLADYGIGKLIESGGAWSLVKGFTSRFQRTEGYTPETPDDEKFVFSRDCFSFAAVAISCMAGRTIANDADIATALQEANVPHHILPVLEKCLSSSPDQRPLMASVLREEIQRAMLSVDRDGHGRRLLYLNLASNVLGHLQKRLGVDDQAAIERFLVEELSEVCAILPRPGADDEPLERFTLVGGAWAFDATIWGRDREAVYITKASEVGSGPAAGLRDDGLIRPIEVLFSRPKDAKRAGLELELLLVDAQASAQEKVEERQAKNSQRILRIWRSFLRDRADLEAGRGKAFRYVDRQIVGERVVFTTEIAPGEEIIGQERLVSTGTNRVGGRIVVASFNQVVMEVTFGNPSSLPRRGELAMNTIAAHKALSHQTHALDALIYDRAVSAELKGIILEPNKASAAVPLPDVTPTDEDFDEEKIRVLSQALGVQDILAVEGPPGTGKTKLIAEIVVQWLRRNPTDRILLSSQTHIALDNVLERVAQIDASVDLIRIGRADEPRISEASKRLLLERRLETWILEARRDSELEMTRWADEHGVDPATVRTGMSVERLIQLLRRQEELTREIEEMQSERRGVEQSLADREQSVGPEEVDEETTQIDSEVGELRAELKDAAKQEVILRDAMRAMGGYAAELADSQDKGELADWALHFLSGDPTIEACRWRLKLLEDWHLRVGRSSDFNAAVLSSAQVIAGTCIGVAGVRGMEQVAYDLCIIDEASKATPTESLVPMVRSAKWILVGDPNQLPPFFEDLGEDLLSQFDDKEVKATLLDRFLEQQEGLPAGCRAELRNQYRMIEPIGDLVSECFYRGRLNSPVTSHGLKLSMAMPAPVTWFSTHARDDRAEQKVGQTFSNPGEVREVRRLLQRLQFLAKAQKHTISVAVIAGYTAQVQLLREMASQGVAEWPNLDVQCNSVDAFQGRQADVCIYSVVRSNDKNDLGFLREPPRLNVALSRGKSALVIIGDQLFCRSAKGRNPFRTVIDYIEQHPDVCASEELA